MTSRSIDGCSFPPVEVDSSACGLDVSPSDDGGADFEPACGGSDASDASCLPESAAGDLSPPASSTVKDSNAEMSPDSSTRTAIGYMSH
jgi:hypothetical protein